MQLAMNRQRSKRLATRHEVEDFFRTATGNRYWGQGEAWTDDSVHVDEYDLGECPVTELKTFLRDISHQPTDKGVLIHLAK